MEVKYKFIDSRIISMDFQENVFSKSSDDMEITVKVRTTISSSKDDDGSYLVRFKFEINDDNDCFKLNTEIINRIELIFEKEHRTKAFDTCIPDLLRRSREVIKNVTISMNTRPIELPPFNVEVV